MLNQNKNQWLFRCTRHAVALALLSAVLVVPKVLFAAKKNKEAQVVLLGFRTDQYNFENKVRANVLKKFSGERNVVMIPESIAHNYVSDLWRQEAKDSKAKIKRARAYFTKGKGLYDKLSIEQSIRSFNKAVNLYREGVGALRDNRYLMVSHLYLGMSLIVLGKEAEGKSFIKEMIILDPKRDKRVLSKREFPPRVIQLHKEMTRKVLNGPSGELVMDVEPKGAKVYLNGLQQKYEGQFKASLPVGEHFVVIEKKGYRQVAKRVRIKPRKNTLSVQLEEWQPVSPYSLERRNNLVALNDLGSIAKELSANVIILGSVEKVPNKTGKYVLLGQLYDARSREFSKIQKVETTYERIERESRIFARKLSGQINNHGLVIADIRTPGSAVAAIVDPKVSKEKISKNYFESKKSKVKKDSSKKSFFKSKLFWGIAGTAVLGGAGYFAYDKYGVKAPSRNTLTVTP